jgi:hypothetical protein
MGFMMFPSFFVEVHDKAAVWLKAITAPEWSQDISEFEYDRDPKARQSPSHYTHIYDLLIFIEHDSAFFS